MNELKIVAQNGQLLVDSREVAEMTGKRHNDLLRDITGYQQILENAKLRSHDFFIKSTYKVEGNNKAYNNFLLTRKGCDMVANKMTGEKGVLFTAAYVTQFEKMEQELKVSFASPSYMIDDPIKRAEKWIEERKEYQAIETKAAILEQRVSEYEPKISYLDTILNSTSTVTISQIAEDYGMTAQEMNKTLHQYGVQYKINGQWLLYSKHKGQGYTKSNTVDIVHSDGRTSVKMNTRWTQKGRLFIYETLKQQNILPLMDIEINKNIQLAN